ncbi:IncF plasmid conjugative transfer pilus assembly protein TraB (plasmid) [Rhodovastum atsumiense]|uniref:Conjugal transfer protein TraB n=1 Tax=Rhodovastum atsumiense TaxID=504468 RepID=A0A5M6IJU1_9PROT|nr:TraB/VirB10 family protein [Rhodovastum atsumiense]KAA5608521.1 hypothetical protein F1189_28715 [Rhodovastum atsumiense]CAH2605799.1 IncF plasmid conjugative transfer pilus assembly protein TraB [Rhodovastum atsumiense]
MASTPLNGLARTLGEILDRIPPKYRRIAVVGVLITLFVTFVVVFVPAKPPRVGDTTGKGYVGQVLINGREGDDTVESLTVAVQKLQRDLAEKTRAIEQLTQSMRDIQQRSPAPLAGPPAPPAAGPPMPPPPGPVETPSLPTAPRAAAPAAQPSTVAVAGSSPTPPAAPTPRGGIAVRPDLPASVLPVALPSGAGIAAALQPETVWSAPTHRPQPVTEPRPAGTLPAAVPGLAAGPRLRVYTAEPAASPAATVPDATDPYPVFELGPGGTFSGVLLTGLDAPTAQNARRDPMPALLRIKHNTILPNRHDADQRECFVLLSGFGDLSAERAYLRTEELSCVLENGETFHERIEGYVTDETGRVGVRGPVVSKQGAFIARSLVVGIMQGVAEAFAHANQSYTVGVSRSGQLSLQEYQNQTQGGMISGAAKGLDRVAEFYLQQAVAMFPVIEINAGRQVDVVLTRAVKVKLPQRMGGGDKGW